MKETIKINSSSPHVAVIDVQGIIGVEEALQFSENSQSVATYDALGERLEQIKNLKVEHIRVNIRSCGGSLSDALLIHDALSECGATIETHCYGYVASAATVIAQAASAQCRFVSSSSLYLIHNSSAAVEGNSSLVRSKAELLEKSDRAVAELYASRSGRPVESFVELMASDQGRGIWLTASEALDYGLADSVEQVGALKKLGQGVRNLISRFSPQGGVSVRKDAYAKGRTSVEGASVKRISKEDVLLEGVEVSASGHYALEEQTLKRDDLRATVKASTTCPVEDPCVLPDSSLAIGDGSLGGNRRAYSDDLSKFC